MGILINMIKIITISNPVKRKKKDMNQVLASSCYAQSRENSPKKNKKKTLLLEKPKSHRGGKKGVGGKNCRFHATCSSIKSIHAAHYLFYFLRVVII